MKHDTYLIDYEVHVPQPRNPEKVEIVTIKVPARRLFENGPEVLAEGATKLIEDTKARYMGLIQPEEIKALRTETMALKQDRFASLLGLGAKTPSTWENGHERPSRSMNLLLRLIQHFRPSESLLEELHCGAVKPDADNVIHFQASTPNTHWTDQTNDSIAEPEMELAYAQ